MMPVSTNYLTPTAFFSPPHGKGTIAYRVKTFADYLDPVLLDTDINAFFDGLNTPGQPWPHIVSVSHEVYPKADNPDKDLPLHFSQIVYILVSPS